jgi:hypothetical protein
MDSALLFVSQAVEERLSAPDATLQLSEFLEQSITQLGELTALVRGQLSSLERKVRCQGPRRY